MKFNTASPWFALCLLALSGAARADLEPYSFGASETISHQSNVNRVPDATRVGDWESTTSLNAGIDQTFSRQRFTASAEVDYSAYDHLSELNGLSYRLATALNWATIGDLTGAIGADTSRRQYFYGLNGETVSFGRNLETDDHVFANAKLGGIARWSIFGGVDGNTRRYSASSYDNQKERQWSGNLGTHYEVSPDLSAGVTGTYTHGEYPNYIVDDQVDKFNYRSYDLTARYQASGNSLVDAAVGVTQQHSTGQADHSFVNGSLNWTWTPPSHFNFVLGISRDTDADTGLNNSAVINAFDISGRSINNVAHVGVTYILTAKTSLMGNLQYARREYSGANIAGVPTPVSGSNRTTQWGLSAHYTPTRTTDLSCGYAHELRTTDASIVSITPGYSDNIITCTAAIRFD